MHRVPTLLLSGNLQSDCPLEIVCAQTIGQGQHGIMVALHGSSQIVWGGETLLQLLEVKRFVLEQGQITPLNAMIVMQFLLEAWRSPSPRLCLMAAAVVVRFLGITCVKR